MSWQLNVIVTERHVDRTTTIQLDDVIGSSVDRHAKTTENVTLKVATLWVADVTDG